MKTFLFTFFAVAFSTAAAWAQPGPMHERLSPEQQAKLQQLRIAFFSEQLSLTTDEAKLFWPIVDAHQQAVQDHQATMRSLVERRPTSDREAEALIAEVAEHRKAEVDLESELLRALLPVLGAERTVQFPRMEQEFRRSILEAARKRSGGRPGMPPPPRR